MAHNKGFDRSHFAHDGGHTVTVTRPGEVLLRCGHVATGVPGCSNPDRYWHCGAWQKRKAWQKPKP